MKSWQAKLLLILTLAGLVVSFYLILKTNDPASVACSIGGGCETVLSSQYAHIGGISVAWLGLLWYFAHLFLLWQVLIERKMGLLLLRFWASLGLVFSLYLLSLEIFKIHAFCTWCLVSLGLVSLIFVLSWTTNNKHEV